MIERADHMTEPLVKGQFYLVPTVYGKWWASEPRPWPVIGAMHTDPEFFDFREPHYHIDARFVAQKWHDQVVRTPLTRLYSGCVENIPPLSKPIIKRLKCLHPAVPYRVYPDEPHRVPVSIIELRNAYTGHQCQHGKGGRQPLP